MTRESTDVDTAEQVIDSFRILAADKVTLMTLMTLVQRSFRNSLEATTAVTVIESCSVLTAHYIEQQSSNLINQL